MQTYSPSYRPRAEVHPAAGVAARAQRLRNEPGPAALARAAIEPAIAVAILFVVALALDARFGGQYLILALLVFSMTYRGGGAREATPPSLGDIIGEWAMLTALLVALGWASGTLQAFDPRALVAWALLTPFAVFGGHRALPLVLPRMLAAEGMKRTAVIACADALGLRLAEQIRANPLLEVRLAGYFDDRAARLAKARPGEILGTLDELPEYVKRHRIDLIYVPMAMTGQPRMARLLEELHDTTASIYFVPDLDAFDLIQARVDMIGGMPVIAVCESPFYGVNALIKRASDLVLAAAILVLISPVMLAIAIGVKLESPGPVLFKQRRYGVDGREIVIYKFRSMTCWEDGAVVNQATRNDARVTRLGAFLRAYSLDELPQFINVLQGRMSVVGPRPHAVAHNEMYRKLIRGYMIRHKVKPGITGLAQVKGFRGETQTVDKMLARVEQDLAYLRDWSLLLDLQLILRTVVVVITKRNAY